MCLLICNVEHVKLNQQKQSKVFEKHWRNLKRFKCVCVCFYRWCSVLHSSPAHTDTFHPCRFRVSHTVGYTASGHSLCLTSRPHSGKHLQHTRHDCHNLMNIPLKRQRENVYFKLYYCFAYFSCF